MQKQLKRFGRILFFSGAILFLGCQTEELTVSDTRTESGIVHRHINFETFSQQFPQPAQKLLLQNEKSKRKLQRGEVYDSINDFTILTDSIFMAEKDGETYFTFAISREYQAFLGIENLVLASDGKGGFTPILTKYSVTEEEKNQIAVGGQVLDLEQKTTIEPLEGVDFGGVIIPRSDGGCWQMTVSFCSAGLHDGGLYEGGGNCDGHTEIVFYFGCGGESGAGPGPGSSGPGTYPGTSTPGGSGSGGSGTGSGGGTPSTGDPNNGNPLDPNQNPGTGGSGSGSGGPRKPIITHVVYIPPTANTLFTFEFYLSTAQKSWLNQHSAEKGIIYGFVGLYNYSQPSLDLATDMINAGMNGTAISYTPFFKYPVGSNYKVIYPNFTSILEDIIPYGFENDTNLVQIIHNITHVSIEQIKKDLKWGSGAEINITQLGSTPDNGNIKGMFNPNEPNKIYIDIDLVNNYENNYDPNNQTATIPLQALIIYSVLLHELVHYQDYQFDNIMTNNIELGLYFESLYNGGYYEFNPSGNGSIIFIKD